MKCAICEVRKPRRYCPGVRGDICTICCGAERENTVDCPFDCVYLRDARAREKPQEVNAEFLSKVPFSEIRVPARFLSENERMVQMVMMAVARAVVSTPGAIDYDVRDALNSLIRTYKTLESGLFYDTRPTNAIAAAIYDAIQDGIQQGRNKIASVAGTSVRDADIMAMLLLMQREEYRRNNGRKRGRAYIDYLRPFVLEIDAAMNPASSPLIV